MSADLITTSELRGAKPLRIGAVSYLNTKPLVFGLSRLLPDAALIYDYPSKLADALSREELDIALVPSIEFAEHPEWSIVSDACIGCRGPVLSVKLLFRVPPAQVRTLALDDGSRTSVILARVLLGEMFDCTPELSRLPLGAEPAETETDAVLVIGDRAIREADEVFIESWDLGDRWCRWAELPFVFAMWVARPGLDTLAAAEAFAAARDEGLDHLPEIAAEQSEAMQLPYDLVLEYLSRNLHFHLGERELRGLELFFRKAHERELLSHLVLPSRCTTNG